jgi:DNA-binding CsgD family transcriptional regulator/pimeloyl-ACP methyl ester carboxylesterase
MEAPPVQYVTTSDGYSIAYCVSGEGRPLVLLPNIWSHIQLFWRTPWRRSLFEALASRFKLVQFDGRGQGLSSRSVRSDHLGEDYCLDLEAVVARVGLERFVLVARNEFCQIAVPYALKNPSRVEALVLANPASDLYGGFDDLMRDRWEVYTETIARLTNLPSDPASIAADFREAVNQNDHVKLVRALREMNMLDGLERLQMPVLVIASSTSPLSSRELSAQVASLAPGAQYVSVDDPSGSSGLFSVDAETPPAVLAIEQFVAKVPGSEARAQVPLHSPLSTREVEVLRLVAAGQSNAQIADALVISQNTVIRHVSNIFAKIGVANRAEATSYAHRHGIV